MFIEGFLELVRGIVNRVRGVPAPAVQRTPPQSQAPSNTAPSSADSVSEKQASTAYQFNGQTYVDWHHFIAARMALNNKQLGRVAARPRLLQDVAERLGISVNQPDDAIYLAIDDALAEGRYTTDIIDLILSHTYSNPDPEKSIAYQGSDDEVSSVLEAISNSIDAIIGGESTIGQFGRGIKQALALLKKEGDRIEVYTTRDGRYYHLSIVRDSGGQPYIRLERLSQKPTQLASIIDHGTSVQIIVNNPFSNALLSGITEDVVSRYPFVRRARITLKTPGKAPYKLNGFENKTTIVPADEPPFSEAEMLGNIEVTLEKNRIAIVDSGSGVISRVRDEQGKVIGESVTRGLANMFVPREGDKVSTELTDEEVEAALKRVKVVVDDSLKQSVMISRRGEGIEVHEQSPEIVPAATYVGKSPGTGSMQIELDILLGVGVSRRSVIFYPGKNPRSPGPTERGFRVAIDGILANSKLTDREKATYINTIIANLDSLTHTQTTVNASGVTREESGNPIVAAITKNIIAYARKRMGEAGVFDQLAKDNVILLPDHIDFLKIQKPSDKEIVYLHPALFGWTQREIFDAAVAQIGGKTVPFIKLIVGEDRDAHPVSLVVAPMAKGAVAGILKKNPKLMKESERNRLPVIRTDDAIFVSEEVGKLFLELVETRDIRTKQVEEYKKQPERAKELAKLLELENIYLMVTEAMDVMTATKVETSYELSDKQRKQNLLENQSEVLSAQVTVIEQIDAERRKTFLVNPPEEPKEPSKETPSPPPTGSTTTTATATVPPYAEKVLAALDQRAIMLPDHRVVEIGTGREIGNLEKVLEWDHIKSFEHVGGVYYFVQYDDPRSGLLSGRVLNIQQTIEFASSIFPITSGGKSAKTVSLHTSANKKWAYVMRNGKILIGPVNTTSTDTVWRFESTYEYIAPQVSPDGRYLTYLFKDYSDQSKQKIAVIDSEDPEGKTSAYDLGLPAASIFNIEYSTDNPYDIAIIRDTKSNEYQLFDLSGKNQDNGTPFIRLVDHIKEVRVASSGRYMYVKDADGHVTVLYLDNGGIWQVGGTTRMQEKLIQLETWYRADGSTEIHGTKEVRGGLFGFFRSYKKGLFVNGDVVDMPLTQPEVTFIERTYFDRKGLYVEMRFAGETLGERIGHYLFEHKVKYRSYVKDLDPLSRMRARNIYIKSNGSTNQFINSLRYPDQIILGTNLGPDVSGRSPVQGDILLRSVSNTIVQNNDTFHTYAINHRKPEEWVDEYDLPVAAVIHKNQEYFVQLTPKTSKWEVLTYVKLTDNSTHIDFKDIQGMPPGYTSVHADGDYFVFTNDTGTIAYMRYDGNTVTEIPAGSVTALPQKTPSPSTSTLSPPPPTGSSSRPITTDAQGELSVSGLPPGATQKVFMTQSDVPESKPYLMEVGSGARISIPFLSSTQTIFSLTHVTGDYYVLEYKGISTKDFIQVQGSLATRIKPIAANDEIIASKNGRFAFSQRASSNNENTIFDLNQPLVPMLDKHTQVQKKISPSGRYIAFLNLAIGGSGIPDLMIIDTEANPPVTYNLGNQGKPIDTIAFDRYGKPGDPKTDVLHIRSFGETIVLPVAQLSPSDTLANLKAPHIQGASVVSLPGVSIAVKKQEGFRGFTQQIFGGTTKQVLFHGSGKIISDNDRDFPGERITLVREENLSVNGLTILTKKMFPKSIFDRKTTEHMYKFDGSRLQSKTLIPSQVTLNDLVVAVGDTRDTPIAISYVDTSAPIVNLAYYSGDSMSLYTAYAHPKLPLVIAKSNNPSEYVVQPYKNRMRAFVIPERYINSILSYDELRRVLTVYDETTHEVLEFELSGGSVPSKIPGLRYGDYFIPSSNILDPSLRNVVDSSGNVISMFSVDKSYTPVYVDGPYLVFKNPHAALVYVDLRDAANPKVITSLYNSKSAGQREASQATPPPMSPSKPSTPENPASASRADRWDDDVIALKTAYEKDVHTAITPLVELMKTLPGTAGSDPKAILASQLKRLYDEQETEIRARREKGNTSLTGLPIERFAAKLARAMETLPAFVKDNGEAIQSEGGGFASRFYVTLITNVTAHAVSTTSDEYFLTRSSKAPYLGVKSRDTLHTAEDFFALGLGWQVQNPNALEELFAIRLLVQYVRNNYVGSTQMSLEELETIVTFMSDAGARGPSEFATMMRQFKHMMHIDRIEADEGVDREEQIRISYLPKLREAFRSVNPSALDAFLVDRSKTERLGAARPYAIFLTMDSKFIRTVPLRQFPGDIVWKAGNQEEEVGSSQIELLDNATVKNGRKFIPVEELLEAIVQKRLPPINREIEQQIITAIISQGEPGAGARELDQNSTDAWANELVIDYILETDANGNVLYYTRAAKDDGYGADEPIAVTRRASTKTKGQQRGSSEGFFGTGKFMYFGGDFVYQITNDGQKSYVFSYRIRRSNAGVPQSLRMFEVRRVDPSTIERGFEVVNRSFISDSIPELERLLDEENWRQMTGLETDTKKYFVNEQGEKEEMVVKQRSMEKTPFVAPASPEVFDKINALPKLSNAVPGAQLPEELLRLTYTDEQGVERPMFTTFGDFEVIEAPSISSQVVSKKGLRVKAIPQEYLALIPEELRPYVTSLGLHIKVPLPLAEERNQFVKENDRYYLPWIQRYVAVEVYKAIARKLLEERSFTVPGISDDILGNVQYAGLYKFGKGALLKQVAEAINNGLLPDATTLDNLFKASEQDAGVRSSWIGMFLMVIETTMTTSPSGEDVEKISFYKQRQVVMQESGNPINKIASYFESGRAKQDTESVKASLGTVYNSAVRSAGSIVMALAAMTGVMLLASALTTGSGVAVSSILSLFNITGWAAFWGSVVGGLVIGLSSFIWITTIPPWRMTQAQKTFLARAQTIAQSVDVKKTFLMKSMPFAGFVPPIPLFDRFFFINTTVHTDGVRKGTNTVLHELAHQMEFWAQGQRGGLSKLHQLTTHQSVGVFADAIKYVSGLFLGRFRLPKHLLPLHEQLLREVGVAEEKQLDLLDQVDTVSDKLLVSADQTIEESINPDAICNAGSSMFHPLRVYAVGGPLSGWNGCRSFVANIKTMLHESIRAPIVTLINRIFRGVPSYQAGQTAQSAVFSSPPNINRNEIYEQLLEESFKQVTQNNSASNPDTLRSLHDVLFSRIPEIMQQIGAELYDIANGQTPNVRILQTPDFDRVVAGAVMDALPDTLLDVSEQRMVILALRDTLVVYYGVQWQAQPWSVQSNGKAVDVPKLRSFFDTQTRGISFQKESIVRTHDQLVRNSSGTIQGIRTENIPTSEQYISVLTEKFHLTNVRLLTIKDNSGRIVWSGTMDGKEVVLLIDEPNIQAAVSGFIPASEQIVRLSLGNTLQSIVPMLAFGYIGDMKSPALYTILENVPREEQLMDSTLRLTDMPPSERVRSAFIAVQELFQALATLEQPVQTENFGSVYVYPADVRGKNIGVTREGHLRLFDFNVWTVVPRLLSSDRGYQDQQRYVRMRLWSMFMEFFYSDYSDDPSPFNVIMQRYGVPLRIYPEDGGLMRILASEELSDNPDIVAFQRAWNATFAGRVGFEFDPRLHAGYGMSKIPVLSLMSPVFYLPPHIQTTGTVSENFLHRLHILLDISPEPVLRQIDDSLKSTAISSSVKQAQEEQKSQFLTKRWEQTIKNIIASILTRLNGNDCGGPQGFHLVPQVYAIGGVCVARDVDEVAAQTAEIITDVPNKHVPGWILRLLRLIPSRPPAPQPIPAFGLQGKAMIEGELVSSDTAIRQAAQQLFATVLRSVPRIAAEQINEGIKGSEIIELAQTPEIENLLARAPPTSRQAVEHALEFEVAQIFLQRQAAQTKPQTEQPNQTVPNTPETPSLVEQVVETIRHSVVDPARRALGEAPSVGSLPVMMPPETDLLQSPELPAGYSYMRETPVALRDNAPHVPVEQQMSTEDYTLLDMEYYKLTVNYGFLSINSPIVAGLQQWLDIAHTKRPNEPKLRVLVLAKSGHEVNAFAYPDGTIVMTWGLASLLAGKNGTGDIGEILHTLVIHERGHIIHNHHELLRMVQAGSRPGLERLFEYEADQNDLELLIDMGFDPKDMADRKQRKYEMYSNNQTDAAHGSYDIRRLLFRFHYKVTDYETLIRERNVRFTPHPIPPEWLPRVLYPSKISVLMQSPFSTAWREAIDELQRKGNLSAVYADLFTELMKGARTSYWGAPAEFKDLDKLDYLLGVRLAKLAEGKNEVDQRIAILTDPLLRAWLFDTSHGGSNLLDILAYHQRNFRLDPQKKNIYPHLTQLTELLRVGMIEGAGRVTYLRIQLTDHLINSDFEPEFLFGMSVAEEGFFRMLSNHYDSLEQSQAYPRDDNDFLEGSIVYIYRYKKDHPDIDPAFIDTLFQRFIVVAKERHKRFNTSRYDLGRLSDSTWKYGEEFTTLIKKYLSQLHAPISGILSTIQTRDAKGVTDAFTKDNNTFYKDLGGLWQRGELTLEDNKWLTEVFVQNPMRDYYVSGLNDAQHNYPFVWDSPPLLEIQQQLSTILNVSVMLPDADRISFVNQFLASRDTLVNQLGLSQLHGLVTMITHRNQISVSMFDIPAGTIPRPSLPFAQRDAIGDTLIRTRLMERYKVLALEELKNTAVVSEGTISSIAIMISDIYQRERVFTNGLIGYTDTSEKYMREFGGLLLQMVKDLFDKQTWTLDAAIQAFDFAAYAPNAKSQREMRDMTVRYATKMLPVAEVPKFYAHIFDKHGWSDFSSFEWFVEERVQTKEDLEAISQSGMELYKKLRSGGNVKLTGFVIADFLVSEVKSQLRTLELLKTITSGGKQDAKLREQLVPIWLNFVAVEGVRWQYRLNKRSDGTFEVTGPGAENFVSFEDFMDTLYTLPQMYKMWILEKLLLEKGGVLKPPEATYRTDQRLAFARYLGDLIDRRQNPKLAKFIAETLESAITQIDEVDLAFPMIHLLAPMTLQRPLQGAEDNSLAVASLQMHRPDLFNRRELPDERFLKISSHMKEQSFLFKISDLSQTEVFALLDLPSRSERAFQSHYVTQFDAFMVDFLERVDLSGGDRSSVISTEQTAPVEKLTPNRVIIESTQALGGFPVRIVQGLGYFFEGVSQEFRDVYDNAPGMNKLIFYTELKRKADFVDRNGNWVYPELHDFFHNRFMGIGSRRGAGSIQTVYQAQVRSASGTTEQMVIKQRNNNVSQEIHNLAKLFRDVVADLKQKHPGYRRALTLGEKLIDLAEEWMIRDINDREYSIENVPFVASHDGVQAANGMRYNVLSYDKASTIDVKIEQDVPGAQTLNRLLTSPQRTEEEEVRMKRGAQAYGELLLRMLTIPINGVYKMLPDISPGNVMVDDTGEVLYVLDRSLFQNLTKDQADLLLRIARSGGVNKLYDVISRILAFPENQHINKRRFFWRFVSQYPRRYGWLKFVSFLRSPRAQDEVVSDLMRALKNNNVRIPFSVELGIKNIQAMSRMFTQADLRPFSVYADSYQRGEFRQLVTNELATRQNPADTEKAISQNAQQQAQQIIPKNNLIQLGHLWVSVIGAEQPNVLETIRRSIRKYTGQPVSDSDIATWIAVYATSSQSRQTVRDPRVAVMRGIVTKLDNNEASYKHIFWSTTYQQVFSQPYKEIRYYLRLGDQKYTEMPPDMFTDLVADGEPMIASSGLPEESKVSLRQKMKTLSFSTQLAQIRSLEYRGRGKLLGSQLSVITRLNNPAIQKLYEEISIGTQDFRVWPVLFPMSAKRYFHSRLQMLIENERARLDDRLLKAEKIVNALETFSLERSSLDRTHVVVTRRSSKRVKEDGYPHLPIQIQAHDTPESIARKWISQPNTKYYHVLRSVPLEPYRDALISYWADLFNGVLAQGENDLMSYVMENKLLLNPSNATTEASRKFAVRIQELLASGISPDEVFEYIFVLSISGDGYFIDQWNQRVGAKQGVSFYDVMKQSIGKTDNSKTTHIALGKDGKLTTDENDPPLISLVVDAYTGTLRVSEEFEKPIKDLVIVRATVNGQPIRYPAKYKIRDSSRRRSEMYNLGLIQPYDLPQVYEGDEITVRDRTYVITVQKHPLYQGDGYVWLVDKDDSTNKVEISYAYGSTARTIEGWQKLQGPVGAQVLVRPEVELNALETVVQPIVEQIATPIESAENDTCDPGLGLLSQVYAVSGTRCGFWTSGVKFISRGRNYLSRAVRTSGFAPFHALQLWWQGRGSKPLVDEALVTDLSSQITAFQGVVEQNKGYTHLDWSQPEDVVQQALQKIVEEEYLRMVGESRAGPTLADADSDALIASVVERMILQQQASPQAPSRLSQFLKTIRAWATSRSEAQKVVSEIVQTPVVAQTTEAQEIQAEVEDVHEACPLVENPFISPVYAAGPASAQGSGGQGGCLEAVRKILKRPPWKVLIGGGVIAGAGYYVYDRVLEYFAYLGFIKSLTPGPIPPNQQLLPLSAMNQPFCFSGACSVGCGENAECGLDGVCCQTKKSVLGLCSVKGNIHYRYDNTNGNVDMRELPTNFQAGISEKLRDGDHPSVTYCKDGVCNPETGCAEILDRCSMIGEVDLAEYMAYRCDESGFWKPIEDPSLISSTFHCSSDASSIIDVTSNETLKQCGGNYFCATNDGGIPNCESYAYNYRCSVNQQWEDGGFQCTPEGRGCTPGALFEYSVEYPCARKCNAEGNNWEIVDPPQCAPSSLAYVDRTCRGNDAYLIDSSTPGEVKTNPIEKCRGGCANGFCLAKQGDTCSSEGGFVDNQNGGDCPLQCTNGRYQRPAFCGHVDIVPFNNENRMFIYQTLSKLPPQFFTSVDIAVIMDWHFSTFYTDEVLNPFYTTGSYSNTEAFPYLRMITPFEEDREATLIHEFIHAWVDARMKSPLVLLEQSRQLNIPLLELLKVPVNNRKLVYPFDYMNDVVGCSFSDGVFSYRAPPVTDYAATPGTLGCPEDFADSAAWYVTRPCELLAGGESKNAEAGKARYDYFRDKIFGGKEYVPAGGCK